MKKRILSVILACIMVFSLAGCQADMNNLANAAGQISGAVSQLEEAGYTSGDIAKDLKKASQSVTDAANGIKDAAAGVRSSVSQDVDKASNDINNTATDLQAAVNDIRGIQTIEDFEVILDDVEKIAGDAGTILEGINRTHAGILDAIRVIRLIYNMVLAARAGETDKITGLVQDILPILIPDAQERYPYLFEDNAPTDDRQPGDQSAPDSQQSGKPAVSGNGSGKQAASGNGSGKQAASENGNSKNDSVKKNAELNQSFQKLLKEEPKVKAWFQTSLKEAHKANPDPLTNPIETMEDFDAFLASAGENMDIDYLYFLFSQEIEELNQSNQLHPVLADYPPVQQWLDSVVSFWTENRKPSALQNAGKELLPAITDTEKKNGSKTVPADQNPDSKNGKASEVIVNAPIDMILTETTTTKDGPEIHALIANDSSSNLTLHFPLDGKVVKMTEPKSKYITGLTVWDPEKLEYVLDSEPEGYSVTVDNPEFGEYTVRFTDAKHHYAFTGSEQCKVGGSVKAGDPIGDFVYGGRELTLVFGTGVKAEPASEVVPGIFSPFFEGEPFLSLTKTSGKK